MVEPSPNRIPSRFEAPMITDVAAAITRDSNAGSWLTEQPGAAEIVLRRRRNVVRLFQEQERVRVVVPMGARDESFGVRPPGPDARLEKWLSGRLVAQNEVIRAALEAAVARCPTPTLAEVLALLQRGLRFQANSVRSALTFYVEGGRLLVDDFDEGVTREGGTATPERLQQSVWDHADDARRFVIENDPAWDPLAGA